MGRPKGSRNKKTLVKMGLLADNLIEQQEKKKRGRPPKQKVDLFSSGGVISFNQEDIKRQDEQIKKIEELDQEQQELDYIDYLAELTKNKTKKTEEPLEKIEYKKVRFTLGDEELEGIYCGKSSAHPGTHMIRVVKPRLLCFLTPGSFKYV